VRLAGRVMCAVAGPGRAHRASWPALRTARDCGRQAQAVLLVAHNRRLAARPRAHPTEELLGLLRLPRPTCRLTTLNG